MAGSSLLALIDDIATILDDIAVMSKVAARKTAGVLGDDLALNAEQVAGVKADRELPVVWAVAKGSLINKCILVPAALAISAFIPWAIIPLLMMGGLYLCFEGFEKIAHKYRHPKTEDEQNHEQQIKALNDSKVDMVTFEKNKIRGAVRTDFILSAEIIVIALGTVANASFNKQVMVLCIIALVMTIGVYGLVGAIVKLDDAGLYLVRNRGDSPGDKIKSALGEVLLWFAPFLMKTLSVAGMAAMFLVGGGIIVHGIPALHHGIEHVANNFASLQFIGTVMVKLTPFVLNALTGIVAGAITLVIVLSTEKIWFSMKPEN